LPKQLNDTNFEDDLETVRNQIQPHLTKITEMLQGAGKEKAKELQDVLKTRGKAAEKHARGLATERMAAIRKAIKDWEKQANGAMQLSLFDNEEREQRAQDFQALKDRLDALAAEREVEPKRQKALYKVIDQRVYPVAVEILMPVEVQHGS